MCWLLRNGGEITHHTALSQRPPLHNTTLHNVHTHTQGREEPILALSLEPDDPRITFSLMGHDAKLSGAYLFLVCKTFGVCSCVHHF